MISSPAVAETLRRRLVADIGSGVLPPGSRLGGERELAERYGVSRSTLRKVLADLEEAGLVRRVAGRGGGTFVRHTKVEHDLTRVVGVPAYLARHGYSAGTRVLSARIALADSATAAALRLTDDGYIVEIQRVRLADGTPFSLDFARFPADRFPGLLEMPLGGSLYELLEEKFSVAPADAEEVIEVVHATDDEAALLAVEPETALLSITRTTFDAHGDPFEYSHDLLRADRTRIMMRTPGRGAREDHEGNTHYVQIRAVGDA